MTISNPYVETLVESGYDRQDVEVASTMFQKKTFPCVIHGRQFDTEEQYYAELHEYMNGMWQSTKWHTKLARSLKCSILDAWGRQPQFTSLTASHA
jgi:hypothetical protein